MSSSAPAMALSEEELRAITGYAAVCARQVVDLFEAARPADTRPRVAVETAEDFAAGARRSAALRTGAWAARAAAREADVSTAVGQAALAASAAAGAAYLHPLATAHQVRHVLGAAVHQARALELAAEDEHDVGDARIEWAAAQAPAQVADVLARMPLAPRGRTRPAALLTRLDDRLRG